MGKLDGCIKCGGTEVSTRTNGTIRTHNNAYICSRCTLRMISTPAIETTAAPVKLNGHSKVLLAKIEEVGQFKTKRDFADIGWKQLKKMAKLFGVNSFQKTRNYIIKEILKSGGKPIYG